jgi:hypothetical protein
MPTTDAIEFFCILALEILDNRLTGNHTTQIHPQDPIYSSSIAFDKV